MPGCASLIDPVAGRLLERLGWGGAVAAPTCVVAAHPDDETLGLGARLAGFQRLRLIHLTDGAPQDPAHAQAHGFEGADAYATARRGELGQALETLGVRGERLALGLPDQGTARDLAGLTLRLARELGGAQVVVTHAYEGGHPDHDAAAFAVQAACQTLARAGRPAPFRLEFAGYHRTDHGRATGCFWPDDAAPAVRGRITDEMLARKRAALACFASQAEVIGWFDPEKEAYRAAPLYDFAAPPPPGAALYDDWGFALSSTAWRAAAAQALSELAA
jgi:LmbE family N-acetylglucosaminyl deacetylase